MRAEWWRLPTDSCTWPASFCKCNAALLNIPILQEKHTQYSWVMYSHVPPCDTSHSDNRAPGFCVGHRCGLLIKKQHIFISKLNTNLQRCRSLSADGNHPELDKQAAEHLFSWSLVEEQSDKTPSRRGFLAGILLAHCKKHRSERSRPSRRQFPSLHYAQLCPLEVHLWYLFSCLHSSVCN